MNIHVPMMDYFPGYFTSKVLEGSEVFVIVVPLTNFTLS